MTITQDIFLLINSHSHHLKTWRTRLKTEKVEIIKNDKDRSTACNNPQHPSSKQRFNLCIDTLLHLLNVTLKHCYIVSAPCNFLRSLIITSIWAPALYNQTILKLQATINHARSHIPVSGVNPRSLSSVVVDVKDSAIIIPGFLPARGQRQLRALSPLTAAHPRHSAEGR